MTTLITTIVNGSSQLLDASVVIAAALARPAAKTKPSDTAKATPTRLTGHTKTDIGIAPGSITWMH